MVARKERQEIDGQWHTLPKRGAPRPLTRNGGWMTEAEYWAMIRSALRRLTIYWKPSTECLLKARKSCKKGRQKFEYTCAMCKEAFPRKEVEADHLIPCGSLTCHDDIGKFVERLFAEDGGWQCLCKPCHKGVTAKQREGGEWE